MASCSIFPGRPFDYVVPGPIVNGWTAYETTTNGLHVLDENQILANARCICEMAALRAAVARKKPDPERQQ